MAKYEGECSSVIFSLLVMLEKVVLCEGFSTNLSKCKKELKNCVQMLKSNDQKLRNSSFMIS